MNFFEIKKVQYYDSNCKNNFKISSNQIIKARISKNSYYKSLINVA